MTRWKMRQDYFRGAGTHTFQLKPTDQTAPAAIKVSIDQNGEFELSQEDLAKLPTIGVYASVMKS